MSKHIATGFYASVQTSETFATPPQWARHRKFIPGDFVEGRKGDVFQVEHYAHALNESPVVGKFTLVLSALTDTDNGW